MGPITSWMVTILLAAMAAAYSLGLKTGTLDTAMECLTAQVERVNTKDD